MTGKVKLDDAKASPRRPNNASAHSNLPAVSRTRPDDLTATAYPSPVRDLLSRPGEPLDASLRATMEPRFGFDFGQVRVHTDERAFDAAASVGARAFAVGRHIAFGEGQFSKRAGKGMGLIAHELSHVVHQHRAADRSLPEQTIESVADMAEQGPGNRHRANQQEQSAATPVLLRKPDAITAMDINLSSLTIAISLDDGTVIRGAVDPNRTNLVPGAYEARWDSKTNALEIRPWPTKENVVYFEVSGTSRFLTRYDRLRRALTRWTPFTVGATSESSAAADSETAPGDTATAGFIPITPEEAMRRYQNGELPNVKVFPLRMPRGLWRIDVAPITASRAGSEIVVKQPLNAVYANQMFAQEVRTLPLETFLGGVRLLPNELVLVRLYDDDSRLVWVTGEGMLKLSDATDTALLFSAIGTVIEAGTFFIPAGALARPLAGAARTARTVTAAALMGASEAAPAAAGRATPALVTAAETRAASAAATQATTRAATEAGARTTTQAATQTTVSAATRAGTSTGSGLAARGSAVTATQAGANAATQSAATRAETQAAQGSQAESPAAPRQAIAGAEEITVSHAEYLRALGHVFPSDALHQVASMIDTIGQNAARRAVNDPRFVAAVQRRNWTLAGTLFHSAAATEVRAIQASALPAGWQIAAERTLQSGAGGGRADVLLNGPGGRVIEFDWKTTGKSALSTGSRAEMIKHAGQIRTNIGGTLTVQESRSWIDFVRPLMPL